ncbi:MAG: hypothetical protein JWP78_2054 [Mucilaginibacter sp.]|nr:hypothetical protein [Mucilaginibacter sp.]
MILKVIEFLHRTFGIGTDAVANILVTIFTFSAGILITVIFKAVGGYLDRRNHRKLLKLNLFNLIRGIYKQAIGYELYSQQLIIEHNGSFNFSAKSISAVGIFNQLGYKNLYNAVFNGIENIRFRNRKMIRIAFNNVWATIEFLNLFHKDSFAEAQKFMELNIEANESRNRALGRAQPTVENIKITLYARAIQPDLATYFRSIEEIIMTYRGQENFTNSKITNDYFVQPLLALSKNNIDINKTYFQLLQPVELNQALLECSLRYQNQKNLIESYCNQFKDLTYSFYDNARKMKESYRTLFK